MKKILVIEDDRAIRQTTLHLLKSGGFQAMGAENGRIGLKLAEQEQPDLILCDIMMPELDGYSVLAALQQNSSTVTIPFIFLSAKSEKRDLRQGMESGADDYLTKPFTRDELLNAITSRLAKQNALVGRLVVESPSLAEVPEPHTNPPNSPGRLLLQQKFEQDTHNRPFVPVFSIKLDRFDRVLGNLGQTMADRLMQNVTQRLHENLSKNASLIRWQADQLLILLPGPLEKREADSAARFILLTLGQPFTLEGHEVFITASLGVSVYPDDGRDINTLIDKANSALYQARQQGGNIHQFYTSEMQAKSLEQLELEADLYYALSRNEFKMFYQPQIERDSGKIVGVEALLRWQHPARGMVSPAQFIPVAEETGLIVPIGAWTLRTVCEQAQHWCSKKGLQLRVAVNLSARQFNEADLSDKIAQILRETGLDPHQLELELTESTLVQNISSALATINALKALGIQIALDDFGTGYSSLSYLNQFPFDALKIDQSFVRNIQTSPENRAIILATLQMAHRLNLRVIAEGVEGEAEESFLIEHGCDELQGYLYSRPLPPEELEKLLI